MDNGSGGGGTQSLVSPSSQHPGCGKRLLPCHSSWQVCHPEVFCTTGHPRQGQRCLSPGEMEVKWQPEDEWVFGAVYFLPVLSKSSALWHSPLRLTKCLHHVSLYFKSSKIAANPVLAHKSGHATHCLSLSLRFPLMSPKFITFVVPPKPCNALTALQALGLVSFFFSLSCHPFSNIVCMPQPHKPQSPLATILSFLKVILVQFPFQS